MHVVHLLVLFLPALHVEVVEPPLPERATLLCWFFLPQTHLSGRRAPPPPVHRPGNALLQHLHHCCRSPPPRLADKQMNMLRHHHVSQEREIVSCADFTQDLQKEIARPLGIQQGHAPVATARDEVQVSRSIAAFQAVFQRRDSAHPSTEEGCGTHSGQGTQSLRTGVVSSARAVMSRGEYIADKRVGHPPGTIVAGLSLVYDGYAAFKQYQACTAGGN
jgi:hypothetical protein